MGDVTVLVGLSGVGKGTVLEQAMNLSSEDYEVINYGDRMLEIAEEQGLADDRDDLKRLEPEENKKLQREAGQSIVEDSKDGNVIVETHAALQTPSGYLPGLPEWSIKALNPERIVFMDADSDEILERTRKDDTRDREHDELEEITEYREVAREMASTCAVLTGAYLSVINNHDGQVERSAERMVEVLRS